MVEWFERCAYDQHRLGSKPTRIIPLCLSERQFTALFLAWWSWQAVLNYSHISIKLQADSNFLVSPAAQPQSIIINWQPNNYKECGYFKAVRLTIIEMSFLE